MNQSTPTIRCEQFSDAPFLEPSQCCTQMNLVSATLHSLQCHTYKVRHYTPSGVKPILTCDKNVIKEHIANNHVFVCNICVDFIFAELIHHDKVFSHVTQCVIRSTNNQSQPYICTNCLQTSWYR